MVTMLSGVASLERDTIVLRAKAGSERVARGGGWLGGHPPFGYRIEGKGKQARLVPAEEPITNIGLTEAELVGGLWTSDGDATSWSRGHDLVAPLARTYCAEPLPAVADADRSSEVHKPP